MEKVLELQRVNAWEYSILNNVYLKKKKENENYDHVNKILPEMKTFSYLKPNIIQIIQVNYLKLALL